jgi:hypothetical protein
LQSFVGACRKHGCLWFFIRRTRVQIDHSFPSLNSPTKREWKGIFFIGVAVDSGIYR